MEEIDPAKVSQDRAFLIRNRQDSGNEEEVDRLDRTIRPQPPWINDFF